MTCSRCGAHYLAGMVNSTPWPVHVCAEVAPFQPTSTEIHSAGDLTQAQRDLIGKEQLWQMIDRYTSAVIEAARKADVPLTSPPRVPEAAMAMVDKIERLYWMRDKLQADAEMWKEAADEYLATVTRLREAIRLALATKPMSPQQTAILREALRGPEGQDVLSPGEAGPR